MNARVETFDVVVVGGGGAGLAAAAEAARLGRSVVLLEKNPKLGGSTAWSVGSISITNSPHQLKRGIQDTPQAHFEDLGLLAGQYAPRDNLKLRRILVDSTHRHVRVAARPRPRIRGADARAAAPLSAHAPRAAQLARLSRITSAAIAAKLGVDIRLDTRVERLIVENGRAAGVQARDAGGRAPSSARAAASCSPRATTAPGATSRRGSRARTSRSSRP